MESERFVLPVIMGDDVSVNAEDAGVSLPHPGQGVGPQLLDMAGQVDTVTQSCGHIHDQRQTPASEIWSSVETSVLSYNTEISLTL